MNPKAPLSEASAHIFLCAVESCHRKVQITNPQEPGWRPAVFIEDAGLITHLSNEEVKLTEDFLNMLERAKSRMIKDLGAIQTAIAVSSLPSEYERNKYVS